ncbi:MAG: hypothetical protein ACE5HQ_02445 [Gemmatimonadota bacterium]
MKAWGFGKPGGVVAAGLFEGLLLVALGWWPGARATPFPALALWTGIFLLYTVAAASQTRAPASRTSLWTLGLAMRGALFPLTPYYSDDIYRYMWDGWVQTHGINPFLYAPDHLSLAALRTSWHALINHPDVATIYPPAAQVAFFALASIGVSIPVFKLAWLAADLAIAWMLDRLTSTGRGAPSTAVLLYLWSPLLAVEVAWSGHMETLGILPMMAALLVLGVAAAPRTAGLRVWTPGADQCRVGAGIGAGLLLGLGASIKFAPAAALPALYRRRGARAALALVLVPAALYLAYAGAGSRLFAGLGAYAERWQFNPGLFRLLEAAAGGAGARRLAIGAVGLCALGCAWRRWPLDRTLFWVTGTALLLSPTLHPWYVLWILPLAALFRNRAWILFSGLVAFAYWGRDAYHATGQWPYPGWLALLVHLPFLTLLVVDAVAAKRLARGGQIPRGE